MENEKDNELPAGWVETKLDQICEILDSFRIPINNEERIERIKGISEDKLFPYYGATGQVGVIDEYLFDGEYILLGEDGAPFLDAFKNKAYIVNGKFWVNNHAHILKAHLSNQFVLHYLNQFGFRGYVSGTTRLKLTQLAMKEIPVPLPPLAEQHRIVAKLEELFSELDKGVENLRAAQQQLKVYRQAVLQWAFEGKLTEEWRKTDWQWSSLGDFAEDIKIGPFGTMLHESDYVLHGIPVINPKHIKNQRIHPDPRNAVAQAKADDLSAYKLRENDVLLGRRGEMGRTAYVTNKEAGWLCGTGSMIIRLRKNNLAKIYSMILSEKRVKDQLEHNSTGTTMNNLNEKIVKAVSVPVIPLPEQQQIVAEIESRLSVCDKLEETIAQSLLQAEALRQSILKQAFAGKLVPQDPSDEPAEKLLARIRAERAATTPVKKPSKGRTAK